MIKIKDYIFNESEIQYIMQDDKELHIVFKNVNGFYVEATFDDIEWNYGQNKADDEYIELSNKYQRLLNRNEELEEENKRLDFCMQDTYDSANDTCEELQQRINNIKEYIKENEKIYGSLLDNEKIILKIIDGEDK